MNNCRVGTVFCAHADANADVGHKKRAPPYETESMMFLKQGTCN
jgi:hypothetical protein